jgi:hypothetical protein
MTYFRATARARKRMEKPLTHQQIVAKARVARAEYINATLRHWWRMATDGRYRWKESLR